MREGALVAYVAFVAVLLLEDVEVAAHRRQPPIANQISDGRPSVSRLSDRARPLARSSPSAMLILSPDLCRPNRSRIAVLVMPALPACRSARMISSATGSPSASPKMRAADASQYSHTAMAAF